MILSYSVRLLSLCCASFFLVHTAARAAVWYAERPSIRFLERVTPRAAARCLLVLRILPASIALVAVLGVCVPSYLRFEQNLRLEEAGGFCLSVSFLAIALWALAIGRGIRAGVDSLRFAQLCRRSGKAMSLPGQPWRALVIRVDAPFVAQIGVFRPQLVISKPLLDELSRDELSAALIHERAHWIARDNLKRLIFAFLPDVFPLWPGFKTLERNWAVFTERAADDCVAALGENPKLSLASALIRLARLSAGQRPSWVPVASSPLGGSDDLAARVRRLLAADEGHAIYPRRINVPLALATIFATTGLAIAWSATLPSAHLLLERLLH